MYVIANTEKGQPNQSPNRNCWPSLSCGPVPQGIEEAITNRLVVGWNPTRSAILISPTCSANCSWGLTSGLLQRQGLITRCHFDACARRKQGQNDVPQLDRK